MTQDAIPKNRKLTEYLMEALNADTETNAVAYARQEPDKGCNIIERYTRSFNYPDEPHSGLELAAETNNGIKAIFCSDVCAMYNKKLYNDIGGFPGKPYLMRIWYLQERHLRRIRMLYMSQGQWLYIPIIIREWNILKDILI